MRQPVVAGEDVEDLEWFIDQYRLTSMKVCSRAPEPWPVPHHGMIRLRSGSSKFSDM
jgi:hypothetical protein